MYRGIIYEYRCIENDKYYVGQTTQPQSCLYRHKNTTNKCHFHDAINKYGFDKFEYNVVEEYEANSKEELRHLLNDAEIQRIAYRDSYNNGYNMTTGGQFVYDTSKCSHRINPCAKDKRRHITDGVVNKFVKVADLPLYLESGWYIGYAPRDWSERNKKVGKSRKGQQSPRKGVVLNEHTRKLLSESKLGRVGMTNGYHNVMCNLDEINYYLQQGYTRGITRKNNKEKN